MVQQFELFQVFLLFSVRMIFLSKQFSMPEMVFHHMFSLKYYKNYKSGRHMTKMEIVLVLTRFNDFLKRWRGDLRKEKYCQIYQQSFIYKS